MTGKGDAPPPPVQEARGGPRILLVEDSAVDRRLLAERIRASCAGAQVEFCGSVREAVERIRRGGLDGLVLDWFLPDGEADAILAELNRRGGPGVPAIVVTGQDADDTRHRALSAGAVGWYRKDEWPTASLSELLARPVGDDDRVVALLAMGVVHEVTNPLAWIQANQVRMEEILLDIRQGLGDDPTARVRLDEALHLLSDNRDGARRIEQVIRQLDPDPARLRPTEPEAVDVDELVAVAVRVTRPAWGETEVTFAPGAGTSIRGSRSSLLALLVNLLLNAIHVLEHHDGPRRVKVWTRPLDEGVRIGVDDSGPGVPASRREAIFRPLVTGRRGGRGVGLAICRDIAREHRGRIEVGDSPLGGARFTVDLLGAAEEPTPQPRPDRPCLRLLLVEDESRLRNAFRRALSPHDVTEVGALADALDALAAEGPFDGVLADLHLPDANEEEVVKALRDARAMGQARHLAFMTGGSLSHLEEALAGQETWLLKPLGRNELLRLVAGWT